MTPIKRPNDMTPNTAMVVTRLKKHDGKYGASYILKDNEGNALWIQANNETVPFRVRFLERETFTNGEETITYTPVCVKLF